MPYKSEAQRGYMHVHHPEIAARWDAKYGGKIAPSGHSKARRKALNKRRRRAAH